MKLLAIGDIHTKINILEQVEKVANKYDQVVLIGDYADDFGAKGRDTLRTWRRVRELTDGNVVALLGNHEYHYISSNDFYSGYDSNTQMLLDEDPNLKDWLRDLPIMMTYDNVCYSHAGITKEWSASLGLRHPSSPIWARPGVEYVEGIQVVGHTPSMSVVREGDVFYIDTFSTHRDGRPYGDGTVLEVIDGKEFNIRSLDEI